ncbi:MAG: hypothetical protein PVJ67_02310 [Candidatus Pacearchaeota archaeon]|jgi:hypothetical protein
MGFRGCDDDFAEALDYVSRHPSEFGNFVRDFVVAQQEREERINANAENFLKEFGIKYCPFHSGSLVEDVIPSSISLNVGSINYNFNSSVCSTWKFCETPVSFEKGLVREVSKMDLRGVKTEKRFNSCTTCGEHGELLIL